MRANVSRCKTRCVPTCTCCCRFACAAHACALVVEICHLQQGYVSCLGCDCVRSVQARMCQLAHDTSKTAPRIRACRDRATAMERAACGLTAGVLKFLPSQGRQQEYKGLKSRPCPGMYVCCCRFVRVAHACALVAEICHTCAKAVCHG